MHSEGAWLKVAGGEKGQVLEALARTAPLQGGSVAVELGSFIGYTAMRLADSVCSRLVLGRRNKMEAARVVTVECDPVHIALARHFVDLVHVASVVEVQPGSVRDVLPLIGEAFGRFAPGLVFMDQKGTNFHLDHALLDRLHLWSHHACIVADNVVRPGAPVYAWATSRAAQPLAPVFWALAEFLEEAAGVEDWMAVCTT
mmetsp:Transcript_79028/g.218746  ORF Transcript_79028/g.218746 Transcript_79028/m.218746 type:complete len:200 (+) Transcript_79028:527-1126(+)